ncbi:hypothetical protein QQF64_026463 [Cirrhinus molitorella]|uniref:Peptidase A2 domain-containing protein n=1 Tax=Cirrhinus molitorella TaxID=172907 RepID=A0ABR3N9M8_9TELE
MATHPDLQFKLTDWPTVNPQQGESQHSIGDLKAQVQLLQAEVVVLQQCLHDSIDLQKSLLDRLAQQEVTVPVTPLASSTPFGVAQAPSMSSRSVPTGVSFRKAPVFTQSLAVDATSATNALTSMLYKSRLEPPVFASDGSLNPEEWLQSLNVYRTSLDLTDAQILLELPRFLSKEPRKWFTILSTHVTTWAQFCEFFLPLDNQERILRGILDRMQMPDEPLPTFVAHMLGEFRKLKTPPPQQEQIDLIRKHVLEKYRVALYGTPISSVMDLLLRAHELHAVLGPSVGCSPQTQASSAPSRSVHCFKCSLPGFTTRTCPNCSQKGKPRLPPAESNMPGDDVNVEPDARRMDGSDQAFEDGRVNSGFNLRGNFRGGRMFRRGNPPSRRVKVNLYGKAFDATLDTGASLSAVQSVVIQTIPGGDTRLKPWSAPPIQLANGASCCPMGVIWLSLGFMGQRFYHRFVVLQSLSSPIILGMDFMLRSSVTLHVPSRTVVLGDEPVPLRSLRVQT